MTRTAAGWPPAPVLETEIRREARALPGVRECALEFVWDPPWDPSRRSEAARPRLGLL